MDFCLLSQTLCIARCANESHWANVNQCKGQQKGQGARGVADKQLSMASVVGGHNHNFSSS